MANEQTKTLAKAIDNHVRRALQQVAEHVAPMATRLDELEKRIKALERKP
jgi:hypothetical protein